MYRVQAKLKVLKLRFVCSLRLRVLFVLLVVVTALITSVSGLQFSQRIWWKLTFTEYLLCAGQCVNTLFAFSPLIFSLCGKSDCDWDKRLDGDGTPNPGIPDPTTNSLSSGQWCPLGCLQLLEDRDSVIFLLRAFTSAPHHTERWNATWAERYIEKKQRESTPHPGNRMGNLNIRSARQDYMLSFASCVSPLSLVVMGQVKHCWVLCHLRMAVCCVYIFP